MTRPFCLAGFLGAAFCCPLRAADAPASLPTAVAQEASPSSPNPEPPGEVISPKKPQTLPDTAPATNGKPEEDSGKKEALPPLTPENSNLNLAADLELETLDTREKVFLPAGTYRQILRIPIDSPSMESVQTVRRERRPVVKQEIPSGFPGETNKPVWIRYESLEKIRINDEERRGGIDLPVHSPGVLRPRLWYAKSEKADTASSVFYFLFGGLGYSVANLSGWSAGNTRDLPGDFEYRLIRK